MNIGTKVPASLLAALLLLGLAACKDNPTNPAAPAVPEHEPQDIDAGSDAVGSSADIGAVPNDNAEFARHGTRADRDPVAANPASRPAYPEGLQPAMQAPVPDQLLVDDLAAREQIMMEDQSRNPASSEIDRNLPQPSMNAPPPDPETSPSGG